MTGIQINARDDADDPLTVDFIPGNPIPSGGLVFKGGSQAIGDTFILKGSYGAADTVKLTGTQIILAGRQP